MEKNHHNQQEDQQEIGQIKLCPFLNENCIQDRCALCTEIAMMQPGMTMPKKQGICAFIALCMISSTPKTQPQAIRLPPGFLGRG